jgi:hypothetical protein
LTNCSTDEGGWGGAIVPEAETVLNITDSTFTYNYGGYGGAIDDGGVAKWKVKNSFVLFLLHHHFRIIAHLLASRLPHFTEPLHTTVLCTVELFILSETGAPFLPTPTAKKKFEPLNLRSPIQYPEL